MITRRFVVLLIAYVLFKLFTTMTYVLALSKTKPIVTAFLQYQRCAQSTPNSDCIQIFREQAMPQLLLAADFVWQVESIVLPAVFLFAYKEVRNWWFLVITWCFTSRKRTQGTTSETNQTQDEMALQTGITNQVSV
jgi:hypothetical protein